MAQRLTFKTSTLRDVVRSFDAMYTVDKLYDYANYITIYGIKGVIYFEMCIILDGASNDALVRLFEPTEHSTDFARITINFVELKSVLKAIKSETVIIEIEDNSLSLKSPSSTHTMERSTVEIPTQIMINLDNFFTNSSHLLVDFNLLKLYNSMNDIGENLTANTLKMDLYGIMCAPNLLVSTDGISISAYRDNYLKETFMFPKHSLKILKPLPKIGAQCAIQDHRIYIKGEGFECYVGEWSGYKNYPTTRIEALLDMEGFVKIDNGAEVFDTIKMCHTFGDTATVSLTDGVTTTKDGKHRFTFSPTNIPNGKTMGIHRGVISMVDKVDEFYANPSKFMCKVKIDKKVHIFMLLSEQATKEPESEEGND